MRIKGCIFDLDGVLVDTAIYHFQAWKMIASQVNFDLSEAQNELLKGVSRVESLDKILVWAGVLIDEPTKEKFLQEKNENYLHLISKMNKNEILPGVVAFLRQLKSEGYLIALGSASKNSELILLKTGLNIWFDAIIDGNKVSKSKPDPEVFLKGADALGLNPLECVVFEDAQAGIEAAINAGMKSIGIGLPHILTRADKVIETFLGEKPTSLLEFK